ncbi:MAG: hypothetical protein K0Q51_352, partial [Rickettsiaceae bacterium]|nr:hypothetical protein [Rickettsiaceae bacterium]
MGGIFENRFKNIKLSNIKELPLTQSQVNNFTGKSSLLSNFAAGTNITGVVVSTNKNGEAILITDEGQFFLNQAQSLKKGDQLNLRIELLQGEFVARIITVNDKTSPEDIPPLRQNLYNHSGRNLIINTGRREYLSKGNPEEIIDISNILELQLGSVIALKAITTNQNKLIPPLNIIQKKLESSGSVAAANDGTTNLDETFEDYFDRKITLEQSKILIENLKYINTNSRLNFKLINVNSESKAFKVENEGSSKKYSLESRSTERLFLQDNRIFLAAKLIEQQSKFYILTDFGVFEPEIPIKDINLQGTLTFELINVENNSEISNDSYKFDLTKFFKPSVRWDNLEKYLNATTDGMVNDVEDHQIPLPTLGKSLLAKLVRFEEAIRAGGLQGLLNKENFLKETQNADKDGELLKLVQEDMDNIEYLNKQLISNSPNAWQFLLIPLLHEKQLNYIKSFTRHDEKDPTSMRFVVEFTTALTGNLQLDGLIRIQDYTNKKIENFNLIVRSANSMSEDFKNGILEIFQNT